MGRNWETAHHGMAVSSNGLPYTATGLVVTSWGGETQGGPWVIEEPPSEGTKVAFLTLPEIS